MDKLTNSFFLNLFFLKNLPTAWFWGIKCQKATPDEATVYIKHNWFNKNPYKSTYFAALAGAGEFATGILATSALSVRNEKISMLVLHMEASFSKKATGITYFTCTQGQAVRDVIEMAVKNNTPQTMIMSAIGKNEQSEQVCEVKITWTFKAKI